MSITSIEWTQRPGTIGETWNPVTGCNKLSQGCKNCYAELMHKRLRAMHAPKYSKHFLDGPVTHTEALTIPLRWKKPRTVFVNSMSDLFHADVPFEFIDQVFAIMALTPQHTYQILTKRPERMAEYLSTQDSTIHDHMDDVLSGMGMNMGARAARIHDVEVPLPNVWLGTSVEDQATADARIPHLLRCPAAVRFLSCEPLLGPVSINGAVKCSHCMHVDPKMESAYCSKCNQRRYDPGEFKYVINPGIHWVIAGGESGPNARPMHPAWARSLRDQCKAAGVPFFFKQWGEWIGGRFDKRKGKMICQLADIGETDVSRIFWTNPGAPKVHLWDEADHYWTNASAKVGKHNSGRLLDGAEHNEWPTTTATVSRP